MKKKKFEKKCQELIEHEERLLKEAEELIKPMEEPLIKMGLKARAFLVWNYGGEVNGKFVRIKIRDNYLCYLVIGICKIESNEKDLDLKALTVTSLITYVHRSIFLRIYKFDKVGLEDIFERFMRVYNEVLTDGYGKTLARY